MIPALEGLVIGVSIVRRHNRLKRPPINGFEKAREDAIHVPHARFPFCVSTTRKYTACADVAGHAPATYRLIPRTALRGAGEGLSAARRTSRRRGGGARLWGRG